MDKEKNPTPPGESAADKPRADGEQAAASGGQGEVRPGPSVEELLDASRGDVKPKTAAKTPAAPPPKTPAAPTAKTPVTPSAREASANTTAEVAPAGDAPGKAVPASTPAAARVSPATGASKTTSTPTPSVNKGVSAGVAAKVPAATKAAGASAAAAPPASADTPINKMRRRIVWASIAGFLVTSFLMFLRFFLPRAIFEPSNVFRVGFPGDYGIGVDTKWQQQYRIWVVRNTERLFVITAVCTHLGCTPDWKESENKFKCPCHGSGYDSEGVNFEGPAPRPMDRAHVELDAEGQIVVNKDRVYKWEKGKESEFDETGAFIRVG